MLVPMLVKAAIGARLQTYVWVFVRPVAEVLAVTTGVFDVPTTVNPCVPVLFAETVVLQFPGGTQYAYG